MFYLKIFTFALKRLVLGLVSEDNYEQSCGRKQHNVCASHSQLYLFQTINHLIYQLYKLWKNTCLYDTISHQYNNNTLHDRIISTQSSPKLTPYKLTNLLPCRVPQSPHLILPMMASYEPE